jgi:alpha-D-xyloside xylohydrolase
METCLAGSTENRTRWTMRAPRFLLVAAALMFALRGMAQPAPHPAMVQSHEEGSGASLVHLTNGILRIKPCAEDIARITFSPGSSIPDLGNPIMPDTACGTVAFHVQDTDKSIKIVTSKLKISVDKNSGAVHFLNQKGDGLLSESDWPFPRSVIPVTTDGEPAHRASVWFALTPEERFYGLGQHQNGVLNQRNLELELSQDNTNISVPFFLSSKGYGVLWNNASVSGWNNRFQPVLAIHSDMAEAVDYYFIYGPGFDRMIASYRELTGKAPLFPLWAYGYWQSKLAYSTQSELVDTASKYRALKIPLDNIVLDAGWETTTGSRIFSKQYPDPRAMVKALHDEHVQLMVSVWPLFQPGNPNFDDLLGKGFFVSGGWNPLPNYLPGARLYDAFSAGARKVYWEQARASLFDIGVDAFWLDSTEPADLYAEEHGPMLAGTKTALGNGSQYANMYPLMTTAAMYEGQRSATDRKRVFLLTRSAYLGMQRNAAAAWSGDTATTFDTLKRQIPAGLNYSMSGLPYWTTDIGGFVGGDTSDPAYRELFVRWFQYGSFCPIFRAHGTRRNNKNELWSYGAEAQKILTKYDKLRYRLLPYIYTLAARTTFEGYTPMRALAFDFREDTRALDISDEFLLGPSLLVAPVTSAGVTSRNIYLPAKAEWYDFWTGQRMAGARNVNRNTPLAIMPLYIKAGTILPLGPEKEYSSQQPEAPIELRIYPGADADLTLYEDDGTTYDYEKGSYSRIPLHWNDKLKRLSAGAREGSFPAMQAKRDFHITVVRGNRGAGEAPGVWDRSMTYDGSPQQLSFASPK